MTSIDDIVGGIDSGSGEEVEIDFSGAVEFEPLPKGQYPAKILSAVAGKSSTGNPKIEWTFGITDPAFAGRQVKRHTPTTGKGSGLSKQVLKSAGIDTDSPKVRVRLSDTVGAEVLLDLDIDPKNSDFNEVKRVRPPASNDPLA